MGEIHDQIIARYTSRGFKTQRFRESVVDALVGRNCRRGCRCEPCEDCDAEGVECGCCFWRETMNEYEWLKVVPDAFRIDRENLTLEIVEAEVTHAVTPEKRETYQDLAMELDAEDAWTVRLIRAFHIEPEIVEEWA